MKSPWFFSLFPPLFSFFPPSCSFSPPPPTHTSVSPQLCLMITELLEQCDTRESRRATHHQTILSIIFSGLLQMVLSNIEEARRSDYLITLPKFTAFIKYLSAGSGEQVASSSSVGGITTVT